MPARLYKRCLICQSLAVIRVPRYNLVAQDLLFFSHKVFCRSIRLQFLYLQTPEPSQSAPIPCSMLLTVQCASAHL